MSQETQLQVRSTRSLHTRIALLTIILLCQVLTGMSWSSEYKVLHKFKGAGDGRHPFADLILDGSGNLYGTTSEGGSFQGGTIFKLTSNPDGTWTEDLLYQFTGGADGSYPYGGLIFDSAGNLYGAARSSGVNGCGTIFQLTPNPDGSWTYSVLHNFSCWDGGFPLSNLIFDASGNLYGTTYGGGNADYGTVFKLSRNQDGSWTESVLYNFGLQPDGQHPYTDVVFDASGNLYGLASDGGEKGCYGHGLGCGIAYKLMPQPDGTWAQQVIASFGGRPAQSPYSNLAFDAAGNLYGTTSGEAYVNPSKGTVFKLTPNPDGSWSKTTLHAFRGTDGANPHDSLIFDSEGNLYSTTRAGGPYDSGTVFKLAPKPGGGWKFTRIHAFKSGEQPFAGLVRDAAGRFFGTTRFGGNGYGVVFQVIP
jgi:uncharacterized repeat protein (TIGR03803 family)